MIKTFTFLVLMCAFAWSTRAQEYSGYFRTPSGNTYYHQFVRNGGGSAVYINQVATNMPILVLSSATDQANVNRRLLVDGLGNVAIGDNISPNVKLLVDGKLTIGKFNNTSAGNLMVKGNGVSEGITVWAETGVLTYRFWADTTTNMGYITRGTGSKTGIAIDHVGNVGINNDSPTYKLDVTGTIRASAVKVEAQTADFVFDDNYNLATLENVKKFIEENKHLPDIPSAKEMTSDDVDLAEMNMLLLQKIEELTLYQIGLLERIKALEAKSTIPVNAHD